MTRVLSVQSHVVSGYVGNKAAVFPLQLLGFDVDVLNSCSLSNHTGYRHGAPGPRLTGADLATALAGLRRNGLLGGVTHLLTGYIGTPSFLAAIVECVAGLREAGGCLYVCDPVLGDNGKLYVSEELVHIYRERVLPLASVLTPNAFELALLSGDVVDSEAAAFAACQKLHDAAHVPTIVVTSTNFGVVPGKMSMLVSTKGGGRFAVDADLLEGSFTGSGDLIAALILAWTERCGNDLRSACAHAMATVSAVLRRTLDMPKSNGLTSMPELRLVQSRDDILEPPLHLVQMREVEDV